MSKETYRAGIVGGIVTGGAEAFATHAAIGTIAHAALMASGIVGGAVSPVAIGTEIFLPLMTHYVQQGKRGKAWLAGQGLALSLGAFGASIGSIVPIVGTGLGAGVGFALGELVVTTTSLFGQTAKDPIGFVNRVLGRNPSSK